MTIFHSRTSPGAHHELGPSKFPAWSVCPCFESDPAERADAKVGTAQHAALAGLLTGEEGPLVGLSPDARDAVTWAAEYVRNLAGEDPIRCEVRLQYNVPDGFAATGASTVYHGTADALIVHGNVADLVDYKSGAEDRDHLAQLAGYALALFSMRARVKTVRCHVLYGRVRRVDSWALTQADAAGVVLPILKARQDPGRKPVACDYCTFCRDRVICPALTTQVATVAKVNGLEDLLPALKDPAAIMDPTTMARALDLARFVSTWSDAMRKAATQFAKDGAVLPGYRLQERRGSREVTDIQAAVGQSGLSAEEIMAACKLSVPRLADTYARVRDVTKAQALREIGEHLGGLIKEGNPSVSLVADRN